MAVPHVGAARRPVPRRLRGLLVGATAGIGAMAAHQAGGGVLHAVPSLVAIAVSLALGVALVGDRRVGPGRAAVASLLAQELWHAVFLLAATPAGATVADHHATGHSHAATGLGISSMLTLHLVVAVATAALAVGADRAVLGVVRAIADRLRPRRPRPLTPLVAAALPVWTRPVEPKAATCLGDVAARAPPRALRSRLTFIPGA